MTFEGLLTTAAALSLTKPLQAALGVALHPSCLLNSSDLLLLSLLAVAKATWSRPGICSHCEALRFLYFQQECVRPQQLVVLLVMRSCELLVALECLTRAACNPQRRLSDLPG